MRPTSRDTDGPGGPCGTAANQRPASKFASSSGAKNCTAKIRVPATARFVLERIFEGTRRTLAAILAAHADERPLREAIEAFWSYQIPGLAGLARWVNARR